MHGSDVDGVCFESILIERLLIGSNGNPFRYRFSEARLFGTSLHLNSGCFRIFTNSLYAVTPLKYIINYNNANLVNTVQ